MRVVVVADTHIRRDSRRRLPDAALTELAKADVIFHAGDVVVGEVLDALEELAPVYAVLGNNDAELAGRLPETQQLEIDGVRMAMIHDSGPRAGRERRLHRRFPDADLVVFGHSHIPWDAAGLEAQWLLNPGSPTERRTQPHKTLAVVELAGGRIASTAIVDVD